MIINIEPGEVLKIQFIRANSELEIHFDTLDAVDKVATGEGEIVSQLNKVDYLDDADWEVVKA